MVAKRVPLAVQAPLVTSLQLLVETLARMVIMRQAELAVLGLPLEGTEAAGTAAAAAVAAGMLLVLTLSAAVADQSLVVLAGTVVAVVLRVPALPELDIMVGVAAVAAAAKGLTADPATEL